MMSIFVFKCFLFNAKLEPKIASTTVVVNYGFAFSIKTKNIRMNWQRMMPYLR